MALAVLALLGTASIQYQQIHATEQEQERQRDIFCGLVEPYSAIETPSVTPRQEELINSFRHAIERLECTPDPYDGK